MGKAIFTNQKKLLLKKVNKFRNILEINEPLKANISKSKHFRNK